MRTRPWRQAAQCGIAKQGSRAGRRLFRDADSLCFFRKPIPLLLTQFKHSGITSVAISEELLGDLVTTGQATYTQQASDLGPLT